MIPKELNGHIMEIASESNTIVIITGNELRHKRFAYRIQQEFGVLVKAWFEIDNKVELKYRKDGNSIQHSLKQENRYIKKVFSSGFIQLALKIKKKIIEKIFIKRHYKLYKKEEEKVLKEEVEELKKFTTLEPIRVHPKDINTEGFIDEFKELNAYFLLTLSGPLYSKELINSVSGYAINQHAGHSPDFKGSFTTEWALYKRDLLKVSSTVHLLATGADNGPILRRSNPCIFPNDTIQKIFVRVVVLGTELLIEVVQDMLTNRKIKIYNQPQNIGKTYLRNDLKIKDIRRIKSDFNRNWLADELKRNRQF